MVLAQALAQDTPVLLLDEPTTHLDLRHVIEALSLVWQLARTKRRAVLAIFHDLNLAAAYCDQIHVLKEGKVVASGAPRDVITSERLTEVFGTDIDVMQSPVSGLPVVVPTRPPTARAARRDRAHVIGGAGSGAGSMRLLAEMGFEVTAGVLHVGDTDDAVAERLDVLKISVPPFTPIDDAAIHDCDRLIQEAALLVVCDPPFGPGNVWNLRLAVSAIDRGARVILLDRVPIEERDFTGGEATDLWRILAARAATVSSEEQLMSAVGTLVGRVRG